MADAARSLGRRGGLKGGPARARRMTPEERSRQAKKASDAATKARRRKAKERREATEEA